MGAFETMALNSRPVGFRDYLPEVYRTGEVGGKSFLSRFLLAFEGLFEELQSEIEGTQDPAGGGIPDLFSPDTTPPPQFKHRPPPTSGNPDPDYAFLNYLASWVALQLRPERSLDWNRAFFKAAISLYAQRSTLPGMDAMLRAWLKGELAETVPPAVILSDLTPAHTDARAIFQLGGTATLGVDTVLGEGPEYFLVADLITDARAVALRQPAGLDVFQRAARAMLDAEKPAHTCYEVRVRACTMQLAPAGQIDIGGQPGAQIGVTTLLWQEPWVYKSY